MSETIKRFAGTSLILVSRTVGLIPLLSVKESDDQRFRSGLKAEWGIPRIDTERNGQVAVNEADAEELRMLPGIGETLSSLIIREREENGPYYYAEDLEAVKGIGPRTLEGFRRLIDLTKKESRE